MDMIENGKNIVIEEERPTTRHLHPGVYAILVGFCGWLVLSVWIFFSGVKTTDYLLTVVTGFIVIAVGLPFILSRQMRDRLDRTRPSFRSWRYRNFETWTGRLGGTQAAAEILLPIAAVAFGMTALGIVLHLVELTST